MKIKFTTPPDYQQPVSNVQLQVRSAPRIKYPVFQILILLAFVAAVAFGVYQYKTLRSVYTYGIVASDTEYFVAPFDGVVETFGLQRGYPVKAGDLLFTVVPAVPADTGAAEQDVVEGMEKAHDAATLEQQHRAAQAAREIERLEQVLAEEQAKQAHAIALAEEEVRKLEAFHAAKVQRWTQYTDLLAMDAAVQSDVDGAALEMQLAEHNLAQARIDERLARERPQPSEALLQQARLALERETSVDADPALALNLARFKLELASGQREPVSFRAPYDGVVTETNASSGTRVNTGRAIVSLAATSGVWVDAYIPSKRALGVAPGQAVQVYVPGVDTPIAGTVAVESGTAVRVPEILRSHMPRVETAAYSRVHTPPAPGLYPGTVVRVVFPDATSGS